MKNRTCLDSASLDSERCFKYKRLAVAFSYPDDKMAALEYDNLFRANEVWPYGAEHMSENEFQRARALADINGFYRAFGVETNQERPDSLSCELEFMHYLIFKKIRADNSGEGDKSFICLDAQRKFFTEHLYPAAKKIAEKIKSRAADGFYVHASQELLEFLEAERGLLQKKKDLRG